MALGPQVWQQRRTTNTPPNPDQLNPVSEALCGRAKPTGGLWTCTLDDDGGGWIRWCLDTDFQGPSFQLWRLDPDPAARVYTIDTLEDLLRLCDRFPAVCDHPRDCAPLRRDLADVWLGWRRVAEVYDAVHLTEKGQWRTRLSMPTNLYGWDCESTLWFRWAFTTVTDLGTRIFQPSEVDA